MSEIKKGGAGSGKKGHVTEHGGVQVSHEQYSWGALRSAKTGRDGVNGGAMIHPEHWEEMKQVHEKRKPEGHFKDEQGKNWHVKPNDKGGVSLHDKQGGMKIHLDANHMGHLSGPLEVKKSDPLNPEPMYKAESRPYHDDINDLIEKGGEGSGKKGHFTNKYGQEDRSKGPAPMSQTERMNKIYEVLQHKLGDYRNARGAAMHGKMARMTDDELNEHHRKAIGKPIEKANFNKRPIKDDGDYRDSLKEKEMDQFKINEHGRKIKIKKDGYTGGGDGAA